MSQITFDSEILDPIPQVTDFQSWLAGTAPKYQRRACSCGCQQEQKEPPKCEDDSLPSGF